MNEFDMVQLIALVGFLVLAVSALAARQLSLKKGVVLALVWGSIFLGIFLLFQAIGA